MVGDMLEELRTKLAVKGQERIAKSQKHVAGQWQKERDNQAERLRLVLEFTGNIHTDIFLAPGETEFYRTISGSLIEYLRGPGRFRGKHYVQGPLEPTVVDRGALYITNKRVIFRGSRKTRECAFVHLIAINWNAQSVFFSMSNRQNRVIFSTGRPPANFLFYLELALAHYRGLVATLADRHRSLLRQIDARTPACLVKDQPQESAKPSLTGAARERIFAYSEYCIAWAEWDKADPYLRGPEPQWTSQDSDLEE